MWIGPSGYAYGEWRGSFYPKGLPAGRWLEYAAARFDSIELNGTFYSLKSPSSYERWAHTPARPGFLFAVKGSRFITHNLALRDPERALANFFASGVLALGERTGPFLWQLPPSLSFDPPRIEAFLDALPRDAAAAADLARAHDGRVHDARIEPAAIVPFRHAIEPRHPSFFTPACLDLLERHAVALVIADTAGKFPTTVRITADFVYVRLHGAEILYASRYTDAELAAWADRVEGWARSGRDVYVYFDNTARGFAPADAARLAALVHHPLDPALRAGI